MCNSCEVLYINGLKCHEHGCPESWKDETRTCKWCGSKFKPDDDRQDCCDNECGAAYRGYPLPGYNEEDGQEE